jgi:PAS domain S-box-containing protein
MVNGMNRQLSRPQTETSTTAKIANHKRRVIHMQGAKQSAPVASADSAKILEWLEGLHQTLLMMSPDLEITWVSDSLQQVFSPNVLNPGDSFDTLFASREQATRVIQTLRERRYLTRERVTLQGQAAGTLPAFLDTVTLDNDQGETSYVIIVRSVEEQEQCDRSQDETESYLGGILHSSPEAVIAFDPGGVVTYVNPAAERLIGISIEVMLRKPIGLWVRDRTNLERIIDELHVDTSRKMYGQDFEFDRDDGTKVWISVSASPLRMHDGTTRGTVVFLRDVTEHHNIAQALVRKNAELENYVHVVSHDLRSPLTSILGFSQLLRRQAGPLLDEKSLHFLDRIETGSHMMESLISDLLQLSRVTQKQKPPEFVDVVQILRQLRSELKPRLDENGLRLKIPADAPMVRGSRTQMYQVFSNLIGNAIDHMGPVCNPLIEVRAEQDDDEVIFSVRDNGRGIPKELQEKVFEIFRSYPSPDEKSRSTGIGLAIVRKISENAGGRVWLKSAADCGTTFFLSIPHHIK